MLNMLISLAWSFVALVEQQPHLTVDANGIGVGTFFVEDVRVTVRLLSPLESLIEVSACPQVAVKASPTFEIVPVPGLTGPTLRVWSANPDPDACIAFAHDVLSTLVVRLQKGK